MEFHQYGWKEALSRAPTSTDIGGAKAGEKQDHSVRLLAFHVLDHKMELCVFLRTVAGVLVRVLANASDF